MTSPNDTTTEHRGLASRAELARQTLRLRAALHEAEEAERAEAAADPAGARAQLVARLEHLVDQRRQQLDAELAAVRAEVAADVAEARRVAADMVERAEAQVREAEREASAREAAARDAAAREAAERELLARQAAEREAAEREAAAREAAAREAAARELAAREAAEREAAEREAAEREAAEREAAEREAAERAAAAASTIPPVVLPVEDAPAASLAPEYDIWAPTGTSSTPPPPPVADIAPPSTPPPTTGPASVPARIVPNEPIKVEIDAESFARVFGTMIAALIRDQGMRHHEPVAPPPKASFWSSAKHLDVMLIGVTMVIALVVLAAWLV